MGEIEAAIRHSTWIRAAPERVWEALATAEGLDAWFTAGSSVDAWPGGQIRLRWRDWGPDRVTAEDGGPVLEARPGERFVFQWHPDGPTYATTVAIHLDARDGGTVVRLREWGYQDTSAGLQAMLSCAVGWGEALTLLKFYAELGATY